MKNPLHYQLSEYDCGPTSLLNALSVLFEREDIAPDIIRNVMLYSLDCYGSEGSQGKSGTSHIAMMFLSGWLDGLGKAGYMPVSSRYLRGKKVFIGEDSLINDALKRNGVAVVRLYYDVEHYVLLTGVQGESVLMFDPYYETGPLPQSDIHITLDHPTRYNRVVPFCYFNRETCDMYSLGDAHSREAVILFNENTKLTQEDTIEYFI
ncbi:MAG: peptidase C39 [Clostridia bacterium]|nr:peptidase C39 [Clostridia bacterium]